MAPRRHGNICCVASATEDHNRTQETKDTAHTHTTSRRGASLSNTHTHTLLTFQRRVAWQKTSVVCGSGRFSRMSPHAQIHSIHLDWTSNIRSPIYITCRNAVVTTALTSPNYSTPSAEVVRSFAKPMWSITTQIAPMATVNN